MTHHLINLLKSAVLNLRKAKVHPDPVKICQLSWRTRHAEARVDEKEQVTYTPIQQGATQMYPYLGPQLRDEGLMKYGAVKVANHAARKAIELARPKV